MQNMSPLVSRIHFLDGQTRGVSIEFTETSGETLRKIQEKIDLKSLDGWALYEASDIYLRKRNLDSSTRITRIRPTASLSAGWTASECNRTV